ncbi:uncharacterized protein AMSG_11686 [Thecamonas trahens ATCC 50062]|uniref:Uncharacterized protein n=1 Tax=Thecamonas trahens ATCC 50062 TaxID=461836 RepID=A0A0L0DUW9_THETB|nr:hypothetical protein AMSG_11686 [Thecamonas trahens ATCC 50062]KNC56084.1 hypothetical protein AMSG_11686 [Thecamonas trahens ATCC 50062]|eukprot:XP_013761225.1 hypothetical protein AMSG_11686 [Thecamonas trahens ATCC 50062]
MAQEQYPLQICIYTSDLPPSPTKKTDVIRVSFCLENSVGTQTVRYKIADSTFYGYLLEGKEPTTANNTVAIQTDNAEWHFLRQGEGDDACWLLCFISIRVPASQVRRFLLIV